MNSGRGRHVVEDASYRNYIKPSRAKNASPSYKKYYYHSSLPLKERIEFNKGLYS